MCGGDEPEAPPPSPYELEMLQQAENRLKEYQNTFIPLENKWMAQSKMYGSREYTTKKQNEAVAAAKMANSGTTLASAGMQPGAGGFAAASTAGSGASGAAAGLASAGGAQMARDKQFGSALDIVKLGRNQTATSANLASSAASYQLGTQIAQHQASLAEQNAMYGAAGTVVGMAGAAGYNKYKPNPQTHNPANVTVKELS